MPFDSKRYDSMPYRRCGKSGLLLPAVSLGFWNNFGENDDPDIARAIMHRAFDLGITHFDFADNYGPPGGHAESLGGRILEEDFLAHRDELIISSKAGYHMWNGPYGDWGSRKHLISGCDQSLARLGLDYVDIFYHHRMDPETPLEETMSALDQIVRSGRALYAGLSNYDAKTTKAAIAILNDLGTPIVIHQCNYSMLDPQIDKDGTLDASNESGLGMIVFSPLQQGLLSKRYIDGIPADSRAAKNNTPLSSDRVTPELQQKLRNLNTVAEKRGQSLSTLALNWAIRNDKVTSLLVGASKVSQIEENVAAVQNLQPFSKEESELIDAIID